MEWQSGRRKQGGERTKGEGPIFVLYLSLEQVGECFRLARAVQGLASPC